ncbi:serine phosphatase RsbU, regulator of sigma subunit [Bernardetia litoralis DSM 6794]|uniref:histidine kinase n=1 Tax=Bernardetia litoralis (strain ATCC 23117 / DSM 6794 / NBRC 15988 / NCIMB 1366 / Fx l1 / Sio-4) TaxID=880071 RepID=I4AMW7_BERLS|nr:SpoIIE family protein phosphatase [Bernardetia litoralis]AFM05302.1 serine phosphatase RsbU, regulator of sigma subunit [Bernardetia litoralis DSM 6794]
MNSISNTKGYILGGFLFGLLFPFFSWILDGVFFNGMTLGWDMVLRLHLNNPIHFVIDSAPFILASSFGTIGYYVDRLEENNLLYHSNIDKYNKENKAIVKRMRIANTVFPVIITLLLVIGFLLLQDFSSKEQNNIYLIKTGTNQRIISQKILYYGSKIPNTEADEKTKNIKSLRRSIKNLKEGHQNIIQQTNILGSKKYQAITLQNLFDSLEKSYHNVVTEGNRLLIPFSIKNTDSLNLKNHTAKTIRQLEINQEKFSSLMESLLVIYENESKVKAKRLKTIPFIVVVVIITFIISLAIFGIKPTINRVKQAFFDVEEINAKFLEKNKILQASEEELHINTQKLRSINKNLVITQKEIKQKQKLLIQAERMAKMGSFIWDLQIQTINYSDNLPYICRLEEDKIITPAIFQEIIHPDDFKTSQKDFFKATSTHTKDFFTEYRARPPYLAEMVEWKYYRAFAMINYNEKGKALQVVGTIQDVTEEIKQNQRVKSLFENAEKNKKHLEEAQQLAKIVSYDINTVSNSINWSDSFSGVFATNKHEIPTSLTDFRKWVEPLDLKRIEQKWTEAIESKTRFNEIYRLTTPTEKLIYIKEKGHPYFDEEGNLIGKRGTLQDITKSEIARINIEQKSKQIKYQNDSFVSSINYAQRIQSALLGGTSEIQNIFPNSFIFFVPKDIVSGDFYWYAEVDNRKIVVVADCTGHGVPGAFMSLLGTMLLNEIIEHRKITTPSHILEELQQEITDILKQKTTKNKDGMDISIAVVDEDIRVLEFAGARNPLVYIHKKQQENEEENMTVIKGDAISIGGRNKKVESNKYTNHVINLDDVEAFYLYSDGYQDQFGGENGTKFMSKSFRSLLYKTHSEKSMSHQRRALKTNLRDWMGRSQKQIDDICIIGITV